MKKHQKQSACKPGHPPRDCFFRVLCVLSWLKIHLVSVSAYRTSSRSNLATDARANNRERLELRRRCGWCSAHTAAVRQRAAIVRIATREHKEHKDEHQKQ